MSKWKKSSQELIERFYLAIEKWPSVELRKMFGYPCAFIHGNMSTGLHEENWIIRLSEEDRENIQATYGAKPFQPMKGRIMREYMAIPEEIKQNQQLLMEWIEKSINFVSSLPVKVPKKKKSKSKL